MSGSHALFAAVGAAALLAGSAMLVRPDWIRPRLGLPAGEAATYILRIAGMMLAAFGLLLIALPIAFDRAVPAATVS